VAQLGGKCVHKPFTDAGLHVEGRDGNVEVDRLVDGVVVSIVITGPMADRMQMVEVN
jgi:hypothetical protein